MILNEVKYSYNDLTIVPSKISYIESRSQCNPFYNDGTLPIFTAPMASVVSVDNYKVFENNKITPIIPRNVNINERVALMEKGVWVALGLQEFEDVFINNNWNIETHPVINVLIDIANGHMNKLRNLVRSAKTKYANAQKFSIMVGNIANPQTYTELAEVGADFIRMGVGSGGGCFVKGTQVTMADGTTRSIEDIDKGDFVLTVNGPQRVTATITKNRQDTITINDNIECTLDHKFFVVRKKDVTPEMTDEEIKETGFYVEAQYLCDEYLLVTI